jgi:hypothetical protein
MAREMVWILLEDTPDNINANKLQQKFTAPRLAENILYIPNGCGAHRLTRVSTVVLREKDTIGDVVAIQKVCQSLSHQKKLAQKFWTATANVEILDGEIHEARPDYTARLRDVLKHTNMRRYELVRGRVDDDGSFFRVKGAAEQAEKNERLVEILADVDFRSSRLRHREVGCCPGGKAETRSKLYTACLEAGVLISSHHQLPSTHRVGSMTSANADQIAGVMIFDILPTTMLSTFTSWRDGDPGPANEGEDGGVDSEDFRLMMKRKVWRSVHAMELEELQRRIVLNWVSVPADHAWIRLQYLDHRGGVLRDLSNSKTNPLFEALRKFAAMLFEPMDTGPLSTVFWFFDGGQRVQPRRNGHDQRDDTPGRPASRVALREIQSAALLIDYIRRRDRSIRSEAW